MKAPTPQKEHEWLQRLVGEWSYEAPGMEPGSKHVGTETVRSVGGLWVIAEGHGSMPDGGPSIAMLTLGYDPQKKRFVGTWLGSMMTHLWVYEGSLDASGEALRLETEGPSFTSEGKMARYKEVMEFKGDDERVFSSSYLGDDGDWHQFMATRYRRTK